ncbi:hypothetical protein FO519_000184 [Halicephalobus sp. NKZ332]|nr:hypothetical protein FO519_000184 [Halicephalobus sp. NKZ332]
MKCEICLHSAGCYRYGARVCGACGAFFRRQILNPKPLYCKYLNNCGTEKFKILKCKPCRLRRCFQVGMKGDRVNYYNSKDEESMPPPVEHVIYAQVLESLVEVCKEDRQGTVRYLIEENSKVLDVAALRFSQNHNLEQVNKRIKSWSGILHKHNVIQEELPLLFQLVACNLARTFYNFHDIHIKFKLSGTIQSTSRFHQLQNMCQRLTNEL